MNALHVSLRFFDTPENIFVLAVFKNPKNTYQKSRILLSPNYIFKALLAIIEIVPYSIQAGWKITEYKDILYMDNSQQLLDDFIEYAFSGMRSRVRKNKNSLADASVDDRQRAFNGRSIRDFVSLVSVSVIFLDYFKLS